MMFCVIDDRKFKEAKNNVPDKIVNVVECANSRCATHAEGYVPKTMTLVNEELMEYKCSYCDSVVSLKNYK